MNLGLNNVIQLTMYTDDCTDLQERSPNMRRDAVGIFKNRL